MKKNARKEDSIIEDLLARKEFQVKHALVTLIIANTIMEFIIAHATFDADFIFWPFYVRSCLGMNTKKNTICLFGFFVCVANL